MAYESYDEDDEQRTPEEVMDSIRRGVSELEERVAKMTGAVEAASVDLRLEVKQSRREMIDVRTALNRIQYRFDNQLLVLVLANIASGVGVAAMVLGASNALR